MRSLTVLGVDPGLTRCGIGVVEGYGQQLSVRHVDCVRTPADLAIEKRLLRIEAAIEEQVAAHRPDALSVERVFSQNNRHSAMDTAQASAVAMLVAARHGIGVHTYTPSEVKAAVSGSGRADKAQVAQMVTRILRLSEAPKPADAADALALAVTHIWRGAAKSRLEQAMAGVR